MGQYSFFVWTSFGVVLVGLSVMMMSSLMRARKVKRECLQFNKKG